jgi:anaerobic selenocysteine-containing dehydrogenase
VLWARFQQYGGWWPATAPEPERLPLAAGRPIEVAPPALQDVDEYPFSLYIYPSGLLSDGRGASQPWLQGSPDPMTTISWQTWIEMHPETAHELGVEDGDVVEVASPHGEIEALVYAYPAIRPDTVAIPLGQGHTDLGRYARDRGSNAMQLAGSATDASGSSLVWADIRVKVRPTGESADLALFEFKEGVIEASEKGEFPE